MMTTEVKWWPVICGSCKLPKVVYHGGHNVMLCLLCLLDQGLKPEPMTRLEAEQTERAE